MSIKTYYTLIQILGGVKIVAETGAKPTHDGSDNVLKGEVSEYLDRLSEAWAEVAAELKSH